MSQKLNATASIQVAKEYTALAIEHGLIHKTADAKQTAKNVTDFFHAVEEALRNDE